MKKHIVFILTICLFAICVSAQDKASRKESVIYVDGNGVMRWSDTKKEASFFGVNYTLPFAHAYRAMGYLGVDRKATIDRDVYHFARLGLNAYRIHLWDVELSDSKGNLLDNEHLDLLDYLISRLKERGIHVVLTAQTNFGDGYPEHNIPSVGFSYLYDKCSVHSNPTAIVAQEHYLAALVCHVNPYTGFAYKDDPVIVGFEVNNEPCHNGTVDETRSYINKMLEVLKQAGNQKPVFYNVSHNRSVVEAYYSTKIQGTTFQWYPTGLVSGHTRRGNFLPFVDSYYIPFSNLKGYKQKARLVYEFDAADILYSYLYPAIVRTFRTDGFQWITQFAYDPIDMAAYNTEYQTHYLNAAYTPHKAVGLMIAAEAARTIKRGENFGCYPVDTVFGDFRVSYKEDLSELNNEEKFYYSNDTRTYPADINKLRSIAGCGSSPIIHYEGNGIYWMDQLEKGVWRLEVMPDAVEVSDPFAKPSFQKKVMRIIYGSWDMEFHLADLGEHFHVTGLNNGNSFKSEVHDGKISSLHPGVYLLKRDGVSMHHFWTASTFWKNIKLGEYVAPQISKDSLFTVVHHPNLVVDAGKGLKLEVIVAGDVKPDSVIIYTDKISFWSDKNPFIKMKQVGGYFYRAIIPASELHEGYFRYNIVVCIGSKRQTFPAGVVKSPLDWDYTSTTLWETKVVNADAPVFLLDGKDDYANLETYSLSDWCFTKSKVIDNAPMEKPTVCISFDSKEKRPEFFVHKYIRDEIGGRMGSLSRCRTLCIYAKHIPETLQAGFITADGYTYLAPCTISAGNVIRLPLSELKQANTAFVPNAYPVFLEKYFYPKTKIPLHIMSIEKLELSSQGKSGDSLEIGSVWLE